MTCLRQANILERATYHFHVDYPLKRAYLAISALTCILQPATQTCVTYATYLSHSILTTVEINLPVSTPS